MRYVLKFLRAAIKLLLYGTSGVFLLALRYFWKTPQPLENTVAGEPRLYKWTFGHILYKISGAQDAPALVLFHAPHVGSSSHELGRLVEPLAERYRVYAPDLLGFGLSDRPRMNYEAETYVKLYHDFLEQVVQRPATVLASGLSCNYAVEVAHTAPHLCERLVLLSPSSLFGNQRVPTWYTSLLKNAILRLFLYILLTPRFLLRGVIAWQHGIKIEDVSTQQLDTVFANAHQFGAEHAAVASLSGALDLDVRYQLEKLKQPVLLLGEERALLRAHSAAERYLLADKMQIVSTDEGLIRILEMVSTQVTTRTLAGQKQAGETPIESSYVDVQPASTAPEIDQVSQAKVSQPPDKEREQAEPGPQAATRTGGEDVEKAEMLTAYCVKCRQKRPMQDPKDIVTRNGRRAKEAECPVCGTRLFRFVGG
jgi:pimeloyl-ACP methyl ester carboxylesterase